MSVTAIVPVWNQHELTHRCLASLRAQTRPFARILVVDNGSATPFSAPDVDILQWPENLGFAPAVNAGWRSADTDHIAVINNDVRLDPRWLEHLLATEAEFATGKLFRPDGLIDGTFDLISRGGFPWRAGHGRQDDPVWNEPREIAMTSFTAVLLRTRLRERVGMLDESFGSYLEDVEFSMRCRRVGVRGQYVPSAVGVHVGSATAGSWSPFMVRQIASNHAKLIARHWGSHHKQEVAVSRFLWRLLALRHGRSVTFPEVVPEPAEVPETDDEEIRRLQQATGFDHYWRWYFRACRNE